MRAGLGTRRRRPTDTAADLLSAALRDAERVSGAPNLATVVLRANLGITGVGSKIGVLSDSVNQVPGGIASSQALGDLPGNIQVLQDGAAFDTDEGRAMLEIIFRLARV